MADIELKVRVSSDGTMKLAVKDIEKLGEASRRTAKSTGELTDRSARNNKVMNDGVRGTANSTKNFSKLAETIGSGGGGLVGAYAALAANTFAVSAAFNALRSAQQAQQVLEGLEAQGARIGVTFTIAAEKLREAVGFGISARDAMSATAQFTSAGFSTDELERLGKVAQNTSLALGRNLPDSIDRLIKGTTKLEPELLDELGIMTKLGDATAAYALETGKTVSSLTQFERRQAFLNAVLAEGELKFDGISEKVDTNPYDKLAGSFDNLKNSALGFVNNTLGVADFVKFLSENTGALTGVVILFASTIQKSLLGSLSDLSQSSAKAAAQTAALAVEQKNLADETYKNALAARENQLNQLRSNTVYEKAPKAVRNLQQAIQTNTLTVEEYDKAIKSIDASLSQHNSTARTAKDVTEAQKAARKEIVEALNKEREKLEQLRAAQKGDVTEDIINAQTAALANKNKMEALNKISKAESTAATAIQTAAEGKFALASKMSLQAIREQRIAIEALIRAKMQDTAATGSNIIMNERYIKLLAILKNAKFAVVTATRVLVTSLLRLLPYIGLVTLAWDILSSTYQKMYAKIFPETSKATEELKKATEDYTKVLETQSAAEEHYAKILTSTVSASALTTQATINRANAMIELADGYAQVIEAEKKLKEAQDREGGFGSAIKDFFTKSAASRSQSSDAKDLGVSEDFLSSGLLSSALKSSGKGKVGLYGILGPPEDIVQYAQTLEKFRNQVNGDRGLDKAFKDVGISLSEFQKLTVAQQKPILAKAMEQNAASARKLLEATNSLNESFKKGETAAAKFFTDAIGSTPFDDIISSFQQINRDLQTLNREGKTAKERLDLISGIGPELQKLLKAEDSQLLDNFREADILVKNLTKKSENLAAVGKKLSDEERQKLNLAKANLTTYSAQVGRLEKSLILAEQENVKRAEEVQLARLQASLEQARLSKYSAYLQDTTEGLKAQFAVQERIVALNNAALSAQRSAIQSALTQQNLQITSIRNTITEQQEKTTTWLIEQGITSEIAKQGIKILENSDLRKTLNEEQLKELENRKKKQEEEEARLKAANDAAASARRQVQAIDLQIAAARESLFTKAQKEAKLALQTARNKQAAVAKELALNNQILQNKILQAKIDAASAGNVTQTFTRTRAPVLRQSQDTELVIARMELDNARDSLTKTFNESQNVLLKEIEDAVAMATTAKGETLKGIEATIAKKREELEQNKLINIEQEKNLNLSYELRLLEMAGLNDARNLLQQEKALLDLKVQQIEKQQELARATFQIAAGQRQLISSVTGATLRNEGVREAQLARKQAEEARDLRIQAVNMEYDLLIAQQDFEASKLERIAEELRLAGRQEDAAQAIVLANKYRESSDTIGRIDSITGEAPENSIRGVALKLIDVDIQKKQQDESLQLATVYTNALLDNFKKLGPDGEAASAVFSGMTSIIDSVRFGFEQIKEASGDTKKEIVAVAGALSQVLSSVISIVNAISDAKIAAVDREIAAEQKRDGKSAESVSKLQALEKKKDDMARKQFNLNKKLMMAQAVMATAAGVANALASGFPPANFILAGIIGAMGAAQIALIASTQYQSSAKTAAVQPPSTLSIGKRSDTVDLARGPSANAGGEAGFLRGSQGMGTNASNFRTIGSAYGGELVRGYGNRGFVVGEKGPEIITPETPINVTPANDVMPAAPVNATININALDSNGVQDILLSQRGNIISMLRQAANASGVGFLEEVDVNVYTRPNVSKL
jgi:hypothetical protein